MNAVALPARLELGLTLDELHEGAAQAKAHGPDELNEWLKGRPASVARVIGECPPWNVYRVKEGAPYRITGPGSIGPVLGATEDGEAIFVGHILCPRWEVIEPDKQRRLLAQTDPLQTHVDTIWLEVVKR